MIINPILPIWVIIILGVILLFFTIRTKNKKQIIFIIVLFILLFIINLRIMIISNNGEDASNDLDVIFVIDTTISMRAEDYGKNEERLEAVKEHCSLIIDDLNGAKFSVVTFNDEGKVVLPFVSDTDIVKDTIDLLSTSSLLYAKGTTLNASYTSLKKQLQASEKKEDRKRVVFFISDGEITNGDPLNSFKDLKDSISSGAVLGYGTTSGGYMKAKDTSYDEEEYVMNNSKKAVSKIDEDNLKEVASDLGISYIHVTDENAITTNIKEIKKDVKNKWTKSNKSSNQDIYFIFIIPLLLLLVYWYLKIRSAL